MIKLSQTLLLVAAAVFCVSPLTAQEKQKKKMAAPGSRTSPHETTYARVGSSRSLVSITYGRPFSQLGGKADAETRKIWGALVPWDKAYRLGSDEVTTIMLQNPIIIGGATIPAGVHGLYMVPSESGASKLVFSSNNAKWGIPVDEKHDIARVDLQKDTLDNPVNQLTITVENAAPGGVIKIKWENTQFSVPFEVKS
jgi:hypothetical protein